jgi:exodeoxyribonuclease III
VRIVSWNTLGNSEAKWDALARLRPNIAILPEIGRLSRSSFDMGVVGWEWQGADKGIGIASTHAPLAPIPMSNAGSFSAAATINDLNVIGIWSCPAKGSTQQLYAREVLRTLTACAPILGDGRPGILAGDLNLFPTLDGDPTIESFAAVRNRLADLDYVSLYHYFFDEKFGAESRATHFHHFDADRPFHIDYCFASSSLLPRVTSVTVGTQDEWVRPRLSDHVPIIVDLDEEPSALPSSKAISRGMA